MTTISKADTYLAVHERLVTVLRSLDDEHANHPAPACPGWSVRDVSAHLTGVASDLLDARFPTGSFDEWNAEQVRARATVPFTEVIDEWERRAPDFADAMEAQLSAAAGNLVADVVSHELDIRFPLGLENPDDDPVLVPAIETFVAMFGAAVNRAGLGAVVIRTDDQEFVAGREDPAATLIATRLEILRMFSGRRTEQEIRLADWRGHATPYLPIIAPYPMPSASLSER